MDQNAITLRNVSKKYQLYESLSHRVYEALHPFKKKYHREFWALRDISLEIPKGATVGILGVNGSGKSTLLQIICSILQPTSGMVEVNGKVAALIELGAGFNPDLTGRENAEINCAIQGLDAQAVQNRLPEIEAFADIGEFFDQPVKTYSSGMFMRVAFATAISVDPEILIIDEALGVGDARFQQKCFRKFRDFQEAGKTILLVTHDRDAVPRLCSLAVLLDKGHILMVGNPKAVTDRYSELLSLKDGEANSPAQDIQIAVEIAETNDGDQVTEFAQFSGKFHQDDRCPQNPTYNHNEHRYGVRRAAIVDYRLEAEGRTNPAEVGVDASIVLYLKVYFADIVDDPLTGFTVKSKDGLVVFSTNSRWLGCRLTARKAGDVVIYKFSFRASLAAADWFIGAAVAANESEMLDNREDMIHLVVTSATRMYGVAALRPELSELS